MPDKVPFVDRPSMALLRWISQVLIIPTVIAGVLWVSKVEAWIQRGDRFTQAEGVRLELRMATIHAKLLAIIESNKASIAVHDRALEDLQRELNRLRDEFHDD